MLREIAMAPVPAKEEMAAGIRAEREKLSGYQMKIKEAKLPVIVMFEGWGAAGKGSILGRVIKDLDPRFCSVATMDQEPSAEDRRYPFLHRYLVEIPEEGKIKFFDTCWMEEVTGGLFNGELTPKEYESRINSINTVERQLCDNRYLIMKFFFQISRKEQKKRLKALMEDKNTSWRVDNDDIWENENYNRCLEVYDKYLNDTNRSVAPWYIIDASDQKWAELQVLQFLNQGIETAMKNRMLAAPIRQNIFKLEPMPLLRDVPLKDCVMPDEEYHRELRKLQSRLRELHYELYRKKIPVIIAYEGWDAAGKGGNIKRITSALDPRGYIVHPIASPEPHEKARFYLWRFWNRLPKTGHIAIFDRTWYGRVMVERLEGFCSENDWQRAYNEMNEFEKELCGWGCVLIKFWVQIDKDTQLERFNDRQNTPEKRWKITDEDWRNRDKWDLYEGAVNEMLEKTSTEFAPWHILESVDKKYARIKALRIVVGAVEKACRAKDGSGKKA
ncbi:polyphosphate:AMP phosphotransferase [Clostridium vitabionis]|uniref:polyphosphate:AMP phosphotransferase n=1 Tax=Clostridium vitabionis TaxID=2784388 RepID=UPI00188C25C8|nr:polyphosphate:AMP phosphotransferase [Clostridium vitabionis]